MNSFKTKLLALLKFLRNTFSVWYDTISKSFRTETRDHLEHFLLLLDKTVKSRIDGQFMKEHPFYLILTKYYLPVITKKNPVKRRLYSRKFFTPLYLTMDIICDPNLDYLCNSLIFSLFLAWDREERFSCSNVIVCILYGA